MVRDIQNTAELLKHDPTELGLKYLALCKDYDLMVVKKGRGDALLAAVAQTSMRD